MGSAAKQHIPTKLETAIALVEPFVCQDPARTHMNSAFHAGLWGRPYVCATDGHTGAIVHCPGASAESVTRPAGAERPPPMEHVLPASAVRVGEFRASALEALYELPGAWSAFVVFRPGESPRLNASRVRGGRTKQRTVWILKGAALDFKNTLEVQTGVHVGYLLRALEFCGVELVTVWRDPSDNLAPLLFTPGTKHYQQADRLAIVMPCRT